MPATPNPMLPRALRVSFARCQPESNPAVQAIVLAVPWLAGDRDEGWFRGAAAVGEQEGLSLFRADGLLVGYGSTPFGAGDLVATTRDLYRRVLAATRGLHLYRLWNYVPQINAITTDLENYRAFCQGRSTAFEEHFGAGFPRELSAASAVGSDGDKLELIFAAAETPGRHAENPEQVPAYLYPPEHGPRPPSFARATVAAVGGRTYTFISGTSAIKGHATIAPGQLADQLACTLDNLRLISREVGAGDCLDAGPGGERHFKIYLRHAADLAAARGYLERDLLQDGDKVTYLRADICRAALNVEIEATLVR